MLIKKKEKDMKKNNNNKNHNLEDDELPDNIDFDYSKSKPNRFAPLLAEQEGYIKLQPDIQKIFKTSEQVNNALRAIIIGYPTSKRQKASTI